jgi:hypothetical protein
MSTTTTKNCDICNVLINASQKPTVIPVVFTTEQTEGRSTKPYISMQSMDICEKCLHKLIYEFPLLGQGAQGYNTYSWRDKR